MPAAEAGPLTVMDRLQLTELLSRYNWALDTYDVEGYAALWTPDGVLDVPSGPHTDMRRFMHTVTRQDWTRGQMHWAANLVFEGTDRRCRIKSQMLLPRRQDGRHELVTAGYYLDTCVKTEDGRWLFERRFWRAWEGDVLTANPSLQPDGAVDDEEETR